MSRGRKRRRGVINRAECRPRYLGGCCRCIGSLLRGVAARLLQRRFMGFTQSLEALRVGFRVMPGQQIAVRQADRLEVADRLDAEMYPAAHDRWNSANGPGARQVQRQESPGAGRQRRWRGCRSVRASSAAAAIVTLAFSSVRALRRCCPGSSRRRGRCETGDVAGPVVCSSGARDAAMQPCSRKLSCRSMEAVAETAARSENHAPQIPGADSAEASFSRGFGWRSGAACARVASGWRARPPTRWVEQRCRRQWRRRCLALARYRPCATSPATRRL